MIAHTAPEHLLAQFGNTATGRAKARQALQDQILAVARREAETAGRSLNCQHGAHCGVHAGKPVGCANSGASCLCECHDPKGQQPIDDPA